MRLDATRFARNLDGQLPGWRDRQVCVALSGGLDSTVLLDLFAAMESAPAALRAVHIDHQLQPASHTWSEVCAAACQARDVPLSSLTVAVSRTPGASLEALAREARYAALAGTLAKDEVLVTAHHADDQAETVLLQMLRGAGPDGLAAMPCVRSLGSGIHWRPLLPFDRAAIDDYARARRLHWVEDPSNATADFDRNYLRHRVMPALLERWPSMSRTLARSAGHSAAAGRLLGEVADLDLTTLARGDRLDLQGLRMLSTDRQANALRRWIASNGRPLPDSRHLGRVLTEVLEAPRDSRARVEWPGAGVRRFRDTLHLFVPGDEPRPAPRVWEASEVLDLGAGLGALALEPVVGDGVSAALIDAGPVDVRWRRGGERIRPGPGRRNRRLKSLFREAGVLPWMRDRVPLIYAAGDLVAVGDLWVDGDRIAGPAERGFAIRWENRPALR